MKNAESSALANLPDYSALKKLAAALWHQDSAYHGAAVMVGAGFSRCAAVTGDAGKRLPLWTDLSLILAKDLGAHGSSDPLSLSEEYCAYFGKQALHDLIKNEISDAAWTPGGLHKRLLELPWSEVLTTNWDTLLERAAMEVHYPVYSLITKQDDLSSASSPRIVKLHGTIGATEDLTVTQEDYRRYRQKYAAFVNFARQVFIENELCLLGFSGDDPNFLQWAGWVRDQLTTHARRIYLVGALHLSAPKRKYLESINIAPIDLGDLVSDYDTYDARHARATEIFLQALLNLKPKQTWEWFPAPLSRSTVTTEDLDKTIRSPDYAATLLDRQLPILESDRESYPRWLVCPTWIRWQLQNQLNDPYPNPKIISHLPFDCRVKLLYEVAWRHSVTYEVIPLWLAQEFIKICNPASATILSKKQQMEVALVLLKNTRWFDDADSRSIESATTAILERNAQHWPEIANEIAFHQALVARDRFDYPAIENLVEKITSREPVWKLRRASLLVELGCFDEGKTLVSEAYRDLLNQCRANRNSIYILSRLAWAHWLLQSTQGWKLNDPVETFPSNYREQKCDPWDHIEHIQERISKALERQRQHQGIEPSFEPGRYRDKSNTVIFGGELHPILLLEGISNDVGIPLRWDSVNLLVEPASRLIALNDIKEVHRFSLAIRASNSDIADSIKKTFSRIQMACIPQSEADQLLGRCVGAIAYWRQKRSNGTVTQQQHAIERLRVFFEVLARVLVRAAPEQAKQAFRMAMEFGRHSEFHHIWLFEALGHLIDYALKSIPEAQHHELLLDAILFPLQSEISKQNHKEWPNPIIKSPGIRKENAALDRRIDEIIDRIAPCSSDSGDTLLRLLPLIEHNYLRDSECQKIAEKIWGGMPCYQTMPDTGLLRYVLLELPSHNQNAVKDLVRKYLFEANDSNLFDPSLLMDISNAAQAGLVSEFPDRDQAANYFDRLVAWRAKHSDEELFQFSGYAEKQKGEFVGEVLAKSVVPSLLAESLTEENFERLHSFYLEVEAPVVIIAFVYFSHGNKSFSGRVERLIRRGLQEQEPNKVASSSFALLKWRELASTEAATRLTSRMIYLIESGRMVGLSALLWTARKMLNKGWLSEEDISVLEDSVPMVFDSADYKRILHSSREAVTASLVRAACVRLARGILNNTRDQNSELLRVLEEARSDPLPEVRFSDMASL